MRNVMTVAVIGTLAASCASNTAQKVEIRAGEQYAVFSDVKAFERDERINLTDIDLSGRPLLNTTISARSYLGSPADLSAVLNACESAAASCDLTVYRNNGVIQARWKLEDLAVTEDTRNAIRRMILSSGSQGSPDGSITLDFDVMTLLPSPSDFQPAVE